MCTFHPCGDPLAQSQEILHRRPAIIALLRRPHAPAPTSYPTRTFLRLCPHPRHAPASMTPMPRPAPLPPTISLRDLAPTPVPPPISLCDTNLMEAVLMGKGEAERKKRSGDERASGLMPPNPSRRSPSVLPLRLPRAPLCLLLDHHHHGMFKAQLEVPCTTCFQVGRWWAMSPTKRKR
jgi:hypothetical protein